MISRAAHEEDYRRQYVTLAGLSSINFASDEKGPPDEIAAGGITF